MDTFQNRLKEAMRIRGMKAVELSEMTGISKPRISQYVNGLFEAKQQALYLLARALNVSEAWLMGYDVEMKRQENQFAPPDEHDLKVALFGGDGEVTDEMWNEVKQFAEFVKTKYRK